MFTEYQDQITQLKGSDARFAALFDKHTALDQQLHRMLAHIEVGTALQIEQIKKEKLAIKDEVYAALKKVAEK